jgi:hypothetical protein
MQPGSARWVWIEVTRDGTAMRDAPSLPKHDSVPCRHRIGAGASRITHRAAATSGTRCRLKVKLSVTRQKMIHGGACGVNALKLSVKVHSHEAVAIWGPNIYFLIINN